jgi:hypothetical protein
MKTPILSSIKAGRLVAITGGMLITASIWAADYPGYVKVENFDGIAGGNVADLTAAAKYISNQPDAVSFVNSLYYSRNPGADTYGSRISGFIIPRETAEYVFFVAADDSTSLYLSTDSSAANLKLIAADQGWQDSRTWTGVGGTSSGAGTADAVFRRGFNPGPTVMAQNGFEWVGPFQNRSDQFLNSPLTNLVAAGQSWPTTNASGNAVINLTANQKYYFELLYKEGSGGENTGVAWKKASDPDPANGDPEISGDYLSVTYTNVLTFMTQPKSQTVPQNQPVAFTVYVVGVPGDSDATQFTYEWLVNGQPIAGAASAATYTVLAPVLSDSGKKYSVRVTTPGGLTGTSAEATLTVISDTGAPTIVGIRSSDTFTSAKVIYSKGVQNGAVDPANYKFSGGLTVTDANFDIVVNDTTNPEDPKNPFNPSNRVAVVLFTSKQAEGASYDLTVSNVKDVSGNVLSPNTAKLYANTFRAGLLNYKRWEGGNNMANLLGDALRFANPTVVDTRTIMQTGGQNNTYVAGTYLDRVDGFFIPTVSTNYVFFVSADNDGYLYLSTDSDPANKKMIAADVGWQNTATWTGPGGDTAKRRGDGTGNGPFENRSDELLTSQRAINGTGLLNGLLTADGVDPDPWPQVDANGNAVISLKAGQRYYFALWHSEGDSGRAEATFKYAGAEDPANGTASIITNTFIGAYADPTSFPPTITNQPANVNFNIGDTIKFNVGVDTAAVTYQWYKNQGALATGTGSTLTISNAGLVDIGSYFVVVANANGSLISASAAALPTTDVPAPQKTFQQDSTGLTSIEAEDYYFARKGADGHLWVPVSGRAGASGNANVAVLPDTINNVNYGSTDFNTITNGPRLDFRINFNGPGTNYLWIRGGEAFGAIGSATAGPQASGNGDSVHAGIDDALTVVQITGTPSFTVFPGWNWVGKINGDTPAYVVVPSAGIHTVSLWMREDGFSADKIVLTTDPAFTPTDTGPAESQQVSSGPQPTIGVARNASGAPVITYTGTLESAAAVNGPYTTVSGASGGSYTPDVKQAVQQYYRAKQ